MTHFDINEMSRRVSGIAEQLEEMLKKYDCNYRNAMFRKAAEHNSTFRKFWEHPENPAEEAYIRQSKIKRDLNNITHLCTVRVING